MIEIDAFINGTSHNIKSETVSDLISQFADLITAEEQMTADKPLPFVEVRFYSGNTQRFTGAREAAKAAGYPDVPTYLQATGQVKAWCEEVPEEEVRTKLQAEQCRLDCLAMAQRIADSKAVSQ